MDFLVLFPIFLAFITLLWMGWIDLKLWILPNELVALFGLLSIPFHIGIYAIYGDWIYGGWLFFVLGGLLGGTSLWLIRAVANKYYGMETMGLGDVKLIFAAGLWFGPQNILIAISVGAFCGVFHALILAMLKSLSLRRMMLPAGPGFIVGIILTFIWAYKDLFYDIAFTGY